MSRDNEQQQYVWQHAIRIVDEWILCSEDESHDNAVAKQDGDGTSWNRALRIVRKRFEEELSKVKP